MMLKMIAVMVQQILHTLFTISWNAWILYYVAIRKERFILTKLFRAPDKNCIQLFIKQSWMM